MIAGMMATQSCKDDDDSKSLSAEEIEAKATDPYGKNTEVGNALYAILNQVSTLDSLPDNWKDATFEPDEGVVLETSDPYTRYVSVVDEQDALGKYNSLTMQNLPEGTSENEYAIEGVGKLTFKAENQSDCFATIGVDIKQLPTLSRIKLVPASVISNSSNGTFKGDAYYSLGDVVRDNENCYWICVRPASSIDGKEKSHWVSFQLSSRQNKGRSVNILYSAASSGRNEAYYPTQLGNNSEEAHYTALLLAALNDTVAYRNMVANSNSAAGVFGIDRAASTPMIINEVARLWEANNIWSKILPKNVDKSYFNVTYNKTINFFYNGVTSASSAKPTIYLIECDGSLYSTYKVAKQTLDRSKGKFDIQEYVDNGRKTTAIHEGPTTGIVLRYKSGKDLAQNLFTEADPTKAIDKVTSVLIYNEKKAKPIEQPFYKPGDILEETINNEKIRWICIAPSQAGKINSTTRKATFVTFDGVKFSDGQANNIIDGTDKFTKLSIKMYQFAFWYAATMEARKAANTTTTNPVDQHFAKAGIDLTKLFVARDSTMGSDKTTAYCCAVPYFDRNNNNKQPLARVFIDNTKNAAHTSGFKSVQFWCTNEYTDNSHMYLQDITDSQKIEKYAFDKWAVLPESGQLAGKNKRKETVNITLTDFVPSSTTANFEPKDNSMYYEPVLFMRFMEFDDPGTSVSKSPDGNALTVKASSQASWYSANNRNFTYDMYSIIYSEQNHNELHINNEKHNFTAKDFE